MFLERSKIIQGEHAVIYDDANLPVVPDVYSGYSNAVFLDP